MIGYDLDGVLAAKREQGIRSSDHFAIAEPLLVPEKPFIAITARRNTPANRKATNHWMSKHYPSLCMGIAMMETSGGARVIIDYKASIINHYDLTDYTDDNISWLKNIAELTSARLWHWRKGMKQPALLEGE